MAVTICSYQVRTLICFLLVLLSLPQVTVSVDRSKEVDAAAAYAPGQSHHVLKSEEESKYPYNPKLPPVIIIPPLTGSILNADVTAEVKSSCSVPVPSQLWPPTKGAFLAAIMGCWQKQFAILVDADKSLKQGKEVTTEPEGVHVHTVNYGSWQKATGPGSWEPVIAQLHELGYRDNVNLFAAPFDWRHGPANWKGEAWPLLKAAVEKWTHQVDTGPAIFISLSMGGPYFTAFLLHADGIDAAWKKKYVAGFVTMAGPFAGTAAAMATMLWGKPKTEKQDNKNKGKLGGKDKWDVLGGTDILKTLTRGFGSVAFLLPKASDEERTLVQLPPAWSGNITNKNLNHLLSSIGDGPAALYDLEQRFPTHAHPGVFTVCMFGDNVPTPSSFAYGSAQHRVSLKTPREKAMAALGIATDAVQGKLNAKGLKVDDQKMKQVSGALQTLAGTLASQVAGASTPTVHKAVKGPPPGSKTFDKAWFQSVARLLDDAQPDRFDEVPGDGLVEGASLSVCEKWTGMEGVKDVVVKRFQGFHHAQEAHDGEALLYLRKVVADMAGVANSNSTRTPYASAPAGKKCAAVQPGRGTCVDIENRDPCSEQAVQGKLAADSQCCRQAGEMLHCMGKACFTDMMGRIIGGNKGTRDVVHAWFQSCSRDHFPSMEEVDKASKAAGSKEMKKKTKRDLNHCTSKMPGVSCPVLRDVTACSNLAGMDKLHSGHECCQNMQQVQLCMGDDCFAGFVAGALATDPTNGDAVLHHWTTGCPNVHFPAQDMLDKVKQESTEIVVAASMAAKAGQMLMHPEGLDFSKLPFNPQKAMSAAVAAIRKPSQGMDSKTDTNTMDGKKAANAAEYVVDSAPGDQSKHSRHEASGKDEYDGDDDDEDDAPEPTIRDRIMQRLPFVSLSLALCCLAPLLALLLVGSSGRRKLLSNILNRFRRRHHSDQTMDLPMMEAGADDALIESESYQAMSSPRRV